MGWLWLTDCTVKEQQTQQNYSRIVGDSKVLDTLACEGSGFKIFMNKRN